MTPITREPYARAALRTSGSSPVFAWPLGQADASFFDKHMMIGRRDINLPSFNLVAMRGVFCSKRTGPRQQPWQVAAVRTDVQGHEHRCVQITRKCGHNRPDCFDVAC